MVVHLAQGLNDDGRWKPVVAVYDHIEGIDQLDSVLKQKGIELVRFQKADGFGFRLLMDLYRFVKKHKIKVIHTHHLGALMYASFIKLMSFGQIQILQTQHSFIHFPKFPRYVRLERWFTHFASQVTAVSPQIVDEYKSFGISKQKIILIPNGSQFAAEPLTDAKQIQSLRRQLLPQLTDGAMNAHWILYLGRIHRGKGQDHALSLWNEFSDQFKQNSRLIFVGPITDPGFGEDLKAQLKQTSHAENIIFAGSTADATSWYQASDLFLSASESEGWPLAPLEALGSGLTCYLSDIKGHRFFFPLANSFSLLDLKSAAEALERAFTQVANTNQRLKNWQAATALRESYSIESMARCYANLYEQI